MIEHKKQLKVRTGAPIMAQQKRIWLASMRTPVRFLALLSGLRIWHCCGCGLGASICHKCGPKKQTKTKKEIKKRKRIKKNNWLKKTANKCNFNYGSKEKWFRGGLLKRSCVRKIWIFFTFSSVSTYLAHCWKVVKHLCVCGKNHLEKNRVVTINLRHQWFTF